MLIIEQLVFAFVCTIGFSILFNIPKDSIAKTGLIGALGWIVFFSLNQAYNSPVGSAFIASLTIGLLGESFARFFKKPATVYITPGIIPLVPGASSYYTMLAIIEKRFMDAADLGTETLLIAISIASGIIIASSISKIFSRKKAI